VSELRTGLAPPDQLGADEDAVIFPAQQRTFVSRLLNRIASLRYLASLLVILGIWSAVTYGGSISPLLLPTPSAVAHAGWQVVVHGYQGVGFWTNVGVSMRRVAIGWGAAVVVGTLLGLSIGLSTIMRVLFDPLIEFYRPIPPLGYLSLLIVWFGIGETSKDVVLFLAALPPTVLNTADAVKAVRADRINGVRTLGGSQLDVMRFVVLPSCLPAVVTGARVSFSNTFTTLVAAETLAASSGLGWLSIEASRYLNTSVVIFAIIVMGIIGMLCDRVLRYLHRRFCPWQGYA
jgi:ABC-type nitrate/sulfonate/bicarbonate transport system, permease component